MGGFFSKRSAVDTSPSKSTIHANGLRDHEAMGYFQSTGFPSKVQNNLTLPVTGERMEKQLPEQLFSFSERTAPDCRSISSNTSEPGKPHQLSRDLSQKSSSTKVREKIGARPISDDLETKKRKVLEGGATPDSVRVCTICNVVCNSDKVLAFHLAGEKHIARVRKKIGAQPDSVRVCTICNVVCSSDMILAFYLAEERHIARVRKKIGVRPTSDDLETKKQKVLEGGATPDSVRVCTICNVVCNSDIVLASHLAGEKHIARAVAGVPNGMNLTSSSHLNPSYRTNKMTHPSYNGVMKQQAIMPAKILQSAYCEVCMIDCNSRDVLNNHKYGKKHKKNLKKLMGAIAVKPATAPTRTVQGNETSQADKSKKTKKKAATIEEDWETKKRKLLERGAMEDSVKVCSLCNVVCNSQTVFDSHIVGQKHAAMVKKEAEKEAT